LLRERLGPDPVIIAVGGIGDAVDARERLGLSLTRSFNLDPEYSTLAIVVHHPEAKYFSMGYAEQRI